MLVRLQVAKALSAADMAGSTWSLFAFWWIPTICDGCDGIQGLDLVGGLDALASDDEVILTAKLSADALDGGAHFAGVVFLAEIEKGLVDEGALMGRGARPDGGF